MIDQNKIDMLIAYHNASLKMLDILNTQDIIETINDLKKQVKHGHDIKEAMLQINSLYALLEAQSINESQNLVIDEPSEGTTIESRIRLTKFAINQAPGAYDADQMIQDIRNVLLEDNKEIEWLRQELAYSGMCKHGNFYEDRCCVLCWGDGSETLEECNVCGSTTYHRGGICLAHDKEHAPAPHSGLTVAQYEERARSTMKFDLSLADQTLNSILGLVGESGEIAEIIASNLQGDDLSRSVLILAQHIGAVADHIKKAHYHGHDLDVKKIHQLLQLASDQTIQVAIDAALDGLVATRNVSVGEIDIKEELGDAQWYIPQACYGTGISLEEVMRFNNEKLFERYKGGFSYEKSRNRGKAE